jgi:hypothetical protein
MLNLKPNIHKIHYTFEKYSFDKLGRIKFNKDHRLEFNEQIKYKCNYCKFCTEDKPFEIDHIKS